MPNQTEKRIKQTSPQNQTTDMTTGNPLGHICIFALPLLIGNFFQLFYNMADSIIVGNFVGKNALAAVGSCGTTSYLFVSLCFGLATGLGIMVSQFFGAKDEENVRLTISNSLVVISAVSIIICILGLLLSPTLLKLLATPEHIIGDALVYMRIICVGVIATAFYNGITMILRALGDSRTPLYFLILSSIINVALNLVFVIVLHLEVLGVALATVIAQAVSAITIFVYAYNRNEYFHLSRDAFQLHKDIIIRSFRLGIPLAMQSSMVTISCLVLQGFVNTFGDTVMAAYTITQRIDELAMSLFNSIGASLTIYAGQNIGAGKIDRVKTGLRQMLLIAFVLSIALIPIAYVFGPDIIGVFVKEQDVIIIGSQALRITGICYFGLALILITRATLNGCGDTAFSLINGITEVSCRIVYVLIFTGIPALGYRGIWVTTGATWVTNAVVCLIRYAGGKWKQKGIIKQQNSAIGD